MIEFLDVDAGNVVGIRIDGKIEDKEFDAVVDMIEEKMEEHLKVRMYVELESLGGMSLKTFLKDMKFGIENYERFDKEAIVTEKTWLESLTPLADKLFNQIEVKTFGYDEKELAKTWIRE